MIITLTKQEISSLIKIMDAVEENGSNKLKKSLKDNKLVTYKVSLTGTVEVQIKPEYMEDFLKVYGKFISLLVPQVKALYISACMFQEEMEQIADKHTRGEE